MALVFFFFFFSITVLALVLPPFALFQVDIADASTSTTQFRLGLSSPAAAAVMPQQIMPYASLITIRSRKMAELAPSSSSVESDIVALIAFKDSVSSDPRGVLTLWRRTNLTSPCGWEGVRCHRNGLRVSALDLPFKYLSGSISPQLGFLVHLVYLDLSFNNFSGNIPPQLSLLAPTLTHLDLHQNSLSGPIPVELGLCKELIGLNLGYNPIAGSIPASFGNLTSLRTLQLYSMLNLTGNIPPQLGSLSSLTYLNLAWNNLAGEIPSEFGSLGCLTYLNLAENNLAGEIPPELGSLGRLTYLNLAENNLAGEIPPELGSLSNLTYLNLAENNLAGEIPPELGSLGNLTYLNLAENNLAGKIPPELGSLGNLSYLNLAENYLAGEIPPELGSLSNLSYLNLPKNDLTGEIPPELGNLKKLGEIILFANKLGGPLPSWLLRLGQLQALDLSDNNFTGSIQNFRDNFYGLETLDLSVNRISGRLPETLGLLKYLYKLNMSRNLFSGAIPGSIADMSSLFILDLSHNKLTGEIPSNFSWLLALSYVDFSSNNLSGLIPQGGQFSTFESQRFLDNPYLCGPPLNKSCLDDTEIGPIPPPKGLSKNLKAAIAVSFSVFIITVGVMAFLCFRRRKPEQNDHEQPLFGNELNLTVQDLIVATGGYNDSNIIGKEGFSTVYKAVLTDGTVVAVKKLHTLNEGEAWRSLVAECKTLGKIRHRNLLKILCTCVITHLKAIVLEYMPNGSLHNILYECIVCMLSWEAPFKIACGIAEGLSYLHYDSGFGQVLHLDLKPGNILLDKDLEPHIGDFGISCMVNLGKDGATLASAFAGSIGYMPPEMGYSDRVTSKADVYSYGVIILELITRKKPTDTPPGWTDYPGWIHSFLPDKTMEVIDPQLLRDADATVTEEGQYRQICLLLKLGLMCTQVLPANRPSMRDVVKQLISIASNYGHTHQCVASNDNEVFGSDEAASGEAFHTRMMEMASVSTSLISSSG